MTLFKRTGVIVAIIVSILLANGLVNFVLIQPLSGQPTIINEIRYHLDDAVFGLVFLIISLLFASMFFVLQKERVYLHFSLFTLTSSIFFLTEWDEKDILFGLPQTSFYVAVLIKTLLTFLFLVILHHILGSVGNRVNRWMRGITFGLFLVVLISPLINGGSFLGPLNFVFLLVTVLIIVMTFFQLVTWLFEKSGQFESRWLASGFIIFFVVLFPDIAKDLVQDAFGMEVVYRKNVIWLSLEDTFPWAIFELTVTLSVPFFRRYLLSMKEQQHLSAQLLIKNQALEAEMAVRLNMDSLLTRLSNTYKKVDIEEIILAEGKEQFKESDFFLVYYSFGNKRLTLKGHRNIEDELKNIAFSKLPVGNLLILQGLTLCASDQSMTEQLFLGVRKADLSDRESFILQLMAKYVSVFYQYYRMMESQVVEMEKRFQSQDPWVAKLFLQMAEKERMRLASDLHDELLQEILHIRRSIMQAGRSESEANLGKILTGLEDVEFMIRDTCQQLMPSFLSENGVLHAVNRLIEKTRLRADFYIDYQTQDIHSPIGEELALTIYRIVQELINNAEKHANAHVVRLTIGEYQETIQIQYQDDGVGTNLENQEPSRLGLKGITERVRLLNGTVTFKSTPGQGMKVSCDIPVEQFVSGI
ncbi:sensor histidine kinase [Pseudoneobacillus sp. C159]